MGRNRSFDDDVVVDAALEAFWSRGYQGTSTTELCEETGIGRSSLYNAFESKDELFGRVLTRYAERAAIDHEVLLQSTAPAKQVLRAFMRQLIVGQFENSERRGCLAVNVAVELGSSNEAVAELVRRDFAEFASTLHDIIQRGQVEGTIGSSRSAETLAQLARALVNGLRVQARVARDVSELTGVIDAFVDGL